MKLIFPPEDVIAELTAKMLLEINAVCFRSDQPFRFTSGWASPVYIDCRKLISYPRIRNTITDFSAATVTREIGFETIEAICGGETAGIPFAAWLADRLMLPMHYVRKKPKGFGPASQIEGDFSEGARTLLVEDLTTDGLSKLNFCKALRGAGLNVNHAFVVFHYNIFPETEALLKENDLTIIQLATWWDVLEQCKKTGYFQAKEIDEVERFLHDPVTWSTEHGGASSPIS